MVPHSNILSHFESFIGLRSSKRVGLGLLLVWLVVVWTVWNSRNDVIFAEGTLTVESIVDRVKFSTWKWLQAKSFACLCSFYEW